MKLRLRSLEIHGFKSFPDKTKMDFEDGITAVVGPNGSGKSNIGDAMRWVMGEQSSKTLRGGKMEDVIFGGTQLRKAQGFAQVQLIIENKDRALHYDSDEISIMRKLYRSGESEYRINGASVRLKDVYELFMDTGLGRDGYSVIGQGKISEIVSAKSSQRREIFEEAAGISKFRYRKAEAQRRLEGAEENLLRLRDILTELESRVEPLRVQAEKAKEFLAYSSEKKTLEISLWIQTLEQSKNVLRDQEDKILLCRNQHDEIQAEIDETEKQIAQAGEQMRRLAVEIDSARTEVRSLEEQSSEYIRQIAVMENDMAHNRDSISSMGEELERAGVTGEELEAQIGSQQREMEEKRSHLALLRERRAAIQEEMAALTAAQSTCAGRIDALKERRYGLTQSINEVKLSSASSTSLIDETIERLNLLRDSAVIKDENVARIQKEIADCTELLESISDNIASLQNEQEGRRMKLERRRQKLAESQEKRRSLEDGVRERRQRAKLLFDMENSLEGFQSSVKYVMNKARSGALRDVYGPVSRLITVDEPYALAIEIALGASMQNIAVKDESVAKRAIAMLKESRSGRATFLPLSTMRGNRLREPWFPEMDGFIGIAADLVSFEPQYQGMIDQLLGRIVIVQDLDCATALARRGNYRFRVVTLDGQVVNAGGSMTGGYAAKSAGILSRSREIDTLKAEAQRLEDEMAALDVQHKAMAEEISAEEAVLSGVGGELAAAQEDRIRYEAEQKQLGNALHEAVALKEQSAQEYSQLTGRLEELKLQNVSNTDLLADMNRQLEEVAVSLVQESEERQRLSDQAREVSESLSEQSLESMSLSKDIDSLRSMMEQLSGQRADRQARIQDLEKRIRETQKQNQEIEQKIEQTLRLKAESTEKIASLNEAIRQKSAQRDMHEAQSVQLRAGEKEVLSRRENIGRELARLEEKRDGMQAEYDGIIARLWEEYEITRSQAMELAQPIDDLPQAQRRLAELKGLIKALGSVNVAAVEEYKEVSGRYQFLKDQTDDAEKSRSELIRLINQLTEEMQRLFIENFRTIAANFSRIFVELFGGGKAELSLTLPENVLESGIEIHVQPPGKLIGNLAVLSGGEQALVAIAIYFAILKVRPSPFVLLDEIEAALDDVNVVKYAQYLRTICDKTQFIAITHRRGTMEEADILYGVTMQEEGVSKLLTLKVGEIESKLGIK